MPVLTADTVEFIRKKAFGTGFSEMRVIQAGSAAEDFRKFYRDYLSRDYRADMSFLADAERRFTPETLLPGVNTLFIFLHPYRNRKSESFFRKSLFKIARYAQGRDYHRYLRKKLKNIFLSIEGSHRPVVDSGPLPERYLARTAGLGFIGRSGMLINRRQGTYFFIASVLSTAEVGKEILSNTPPSDAAGFLHDMQQGCGSCRACIDACPGGAILEQGLVDSRNCISYLTIEKKDRQKFSLKKKHRYVFGCDICQMVCPYNQYSVFSLLSAFEPGRAAETLAGGQLPAASQLRGSPLKRSRHRLDVNISSVADN